MLTRVLFAGLFLAAAVTGHVSAQEPMKPKVILEWRSEVIRSLAFTSDGKQLVVSPKESDCWVFNAATGEKLPADITGGRGPINFLLAGPRPGTVYCLEKLACRLMDTNTGKQIAINGNSVDHSPSGALSANKNVLALASASGGVELLSADLARSETSFEPGDQQPPNPKDWRACAAAYSSDGKLIAAARPNGRLCLWTADGFKETGKFATSAHSGRIEALAFTPTGLVSIGVDGRLKCWSTPDLKELFVHSFGAQLDRAWLLANGQIAALVRKPVAGEIEFFQVPAREGGQPKLLATIPIVSLFDGFPTVHREFTIPQISISPDGKSLALAAKSGSNELAINRIAIYDVSIFMPKLAVPVPSPNDTLPRVADNPAPAKTTPTPVPAKVESEFRVWTTADGAFSVEAQFAGKIGDTIRLKRKDNDKVISVPLDKLGDADQAYVKGLR